MGPNQPYEDWLKQALGVSDLEGVTITDPKTGQRRVQIAGRWQKLSADPATKLPTTAQIKFPAESSEGTNILDQETGKLYQYQNGQWVGSKLAADAEVPAPPPPAAIRPPVDAPDIQACVSRWLSGRASGGIEYVVIEENSSAGTRLEIARASSARPLSGDEVQMYGVKVAVSGNTQNEEPGTQPVVPLSEAVSITANQPKP